MHREQDHPVTQVMAWIGLNILLPLLPVVFGVVITVMQRQTVDFFKLLDGLELFLISLWLVTVTARDLARYKFSWEKPLRMALIALAAIDLIFLVLIYVNNRIRDLELDAEMYLSLAMAHFIFIVVIAVALQLYMHYYDYRENQMEDIA